MQITLELPDDIAKQLAQDDDLFASRRSRSTGARSSTHAPHIRPSGGGNAWLNRHELDGFLKQHGIAMDYSIEDYQRESEVSERLWQKRAAELC